MTSLQLRLKAKKDGAAPRQEILKRIWDSQGPDAVMELMESEPAARDSGLAEELRRESAELSQYQSGSVERLVEMAEVVEGHREAVARFAAVRTLRELLDAYRERPNCHGSNFNRLLGSFWLDAIREGDIERAADLRRGMRVLSNVYSAIQDIAKSGRLKPEEWARRIVASELLGDPTFHEFLDSRALFLAKQKHPTAEIFGKLARSIRICSRVAPSIVASEDRKAGKSDGGFIKVNIPVPAIRAELWFLVSKAFAGLAEKLSAEIAHGSCTIHSGMEEAIRSAGPEPSDLQIAAGEDEKSIRIFLGSAFLEHLFLHSNRPVIADALQVYHGLTQGQDWGTAEKRGIVVLHYTKAVLNQWRNVEAPLKLLSEAAQAIAVALNSVDESTPRLLRDLWVTRARLLENVGFWEPEAYMESLTAYEKALSVQKIKHEAEARGRALTDYANTLGRIRAVNEEEHDAKIMATYQEALTTFELEKSVIGKTLALHSFAIYLNERAYEEQSVNQERALSLVQEAISLLEADQDADRANDLVGRTLASAYLTKSNILRHRETGDPLEATKLAKDMLHTAQARLGKKTVDDQLRGILSINLGQVNVELYELTADPTNLVHASYAFQEAEELLKGFPNEYSQALLGSAMLVSEGGEEQSEEAIRESIEKAGQALRLLENAEDLQARARAHLCFGELHSLLGPASNLELVKQSFEAARMYFLEAKRYDHAIAVSRRIAGLWVETFTRDGNLDALREAEQVLQQATDWIEILWLQINSIQWRFEISERYSDVYAEVAWCKTTLGDAVEEISLSLVRSKGREFCSHSAETRRGIQLKGGLADFMDQLRLQSRKAERLPWEAGKNVALDIDVNEAVQTSRKALKEIELKRRLIFPPPVADAGERPLSSVIEFLQTNPSSLVLDLSVCRWGTVAFLAGGQKTGAFAGFSVHLLPLSAPSARELIDPWSAAYSEYLQAASTVKDDARLSWANETERLLEALSQQLLIPCMPHEVAAGISLVIVPGRLGGLPIHAARLKDGRYASEAFASVTYCPNMAVLSSELLIWRKPVSPLFVISDGGRDLLSAASECAVAIERVGSENAAVKVFAQVGGHSGRAALAERRVFLPQEVNVIESAPTPELLAKHIPDADHFFYSGHGIGGTNQSGLVTVDADGKPAALSESDILAMHVLRGRPVVVLSACETAMGGRGSSELFDLASAFLRIGAEFVVGSMWLVIEDCATTFTASFYEALATGEPPDRAFGTALRFVRQIRTSRPTIRAVPADHPIYWAPFMALRG